MANVIKHKRGSGSDPVASDLVVGEVAIRTDVGKLFTKMDNGSVAEIAGGGSDIAINTLSSSSGTGGGSATFNGSAYRFTLSAPPSVSAQQLLVSINGVIQKPVAGTGQPSEGFSVDGTDIILGDAPATGSDFFILTFKSLGVSEPADNSVTSAKIVDGAIVNADINASAAIAGTKISPDFGSQAITTTNDSVTIGNSIIHSGDTDTKINFPAANTFTINTAGAERLRVDSSGRVGIGVTNPDRELDISNSSGNCTISLRSSDSHTTQLLFGDVSAELRGRVGYQSSDVLDFYTAALERMRIDSSGRLLVGGTDPSVVHTNADDVVIGNTSASVAGLSIATSTSGYATLQFSDGAGSKNQGQIAYNHADNSLALTTDSSVRMTIDSSGEVGIGTTSPDQLLSLQNTSAQCQQSLTAATNGSCAIYFGDTDSVNRSKILHHNTGDYLSFSTAAAERMRIDSSGRVGIGTTSPSSKLHINCGSDNTAVQINSTDAGSFYQAIDNTGESIFGHSGANAIISVDPGASVSSSAIVFQVDGNSEKMRINSSGNVGIGGTAPNYQLHVVNGIGVGSHGFAQQLSITNNKIQSLLLGTGYTNMTINALGGLVGIGTGTTSLAARLHVENGGSGNVAFLKHASSGIAVTLKLQNNRATGTLAGEQISFTDDTGTQRGKITNTTATTTYHTSSDYRLKENEVLISDGIERIKQLKPYKFSWKHIPNKIVDGFFAHEVENLVEDCVDGTKDRVVTKDDHDKGDYLDKEIGTEIHQMMDHSKLVPLIVAALQEAIGRIEVLEAK